VIRDNTVDSNGDTMGIRLF